MQATWKILDLEAKGLGRVIDGLFHSKFSQDKIGSKFNGPREAANFQLTAFLAH
jgi:hypothetical protein